MNKPHHPEEIWLGKNEYSVWKDLKVNGWLLVAALLSGAGEIYFASAVSDWSVAWRAGVAVAPFAALLLWVRSLTVWVRGMDEMHRRIVQAAILFATASVFFFVTFAHRLAEVIFAVNPGDHHPIPTVAHIILLLTVSYLLAYRFFSRRYQ